MKTKDTDKQVQQRLFDIQTEVAKIDESLKKMLENQTPGQATGLGTKTLILLQRKEAIKKLIDSGWTPHQIATAISTDSFSILPKSITSLFVTPKKITDTVSTPAKKSKPKKTTEPAKETHKAATTVLPKTAETDRSTISVRKDEAL